VIDTPGGGLVKGRSERGWDIPVGVDEDDLCSIVKGRGRVGPEFWAFLIVAVVAATCLFAVFFYAIPKLKGNPQAISIGATQDEVRAALGVPDDRKADRDGGETWHYYEGWNCYGFDFNAEGVLIRKFRAD
jgi:hypothetical protein